jgi:hypothetical protein
LRLQTLLIQCPVRREPVARMVAIEPQLLVTVPTVQRRARGKLAITWNVVAWLEAAVAPIEAMPLPAGRE